MEAKKVLKGPVEYPQNPEQKTQIPSNPVQDLQGGQEKKESEGIRGLVASPRCEEAPQLQDVLTEAAPGSLRNLKFPSSVCEIHQLRGADARRLSLAVRGNVQ